MRFGDIPLEWTDFRLAFRQTADILHRYEAIDRAEHQQILALGRDGNTLEPLVSGWYRATSGVDATTADQARPRDAATPNLDQVLVLAHPAVSRALRRGACCSAPISPPGATATARSAAGNRTSP